MEFATDITRAAHRLGVEIRWESPYLRAERAKWSVLIDAADLMASSSSDEQRRDGVWILLGLRLGLDKRNGESHEEKELSALHFRRTALRRYQETPSVHGDGVLSLVPSITRHIFEAVAQQEAVSRRWILPGSDILILHETGKRLDILTGVEASESEKEEDRIWEMARAALFYDSYKVRPHRQIEIEGGILRVFESSEGLMASRALLLPEFDYDAAQDGGLAAIPSRDCLIIASPQRAGSASVMLPELSQMIDDIWAENAFRFSDAIIELAPEKVDVRRDATSISPMNFDSVKERLLAVEPVLQTFDGV